MKAKRITLESVVSFLVVIAALGAGFAPGTAHADGELDGKVFVIKGEGGDVLTFENGQFHSSACEKWGFGKGNYTTSMAGDGTMFTAQTSSGKHGKMVWTGTVKDGTLTGGYTWTKTGWFGTKEKTKQFTGVLKR